MLPLEGPDYRLKEVKEGGNHNMTPEQKLIKAKCQLLISEPWFGQLACYLNLIGTKYLESAGITPDGDFYYNSKWVDKLNDRELRGLVCHEILHLAYSHPFREQNRQHLLWNAAADLKINNDLNYKDFLDLPRDGLIPEHGQWSQGKITIENIEEKTTEQIYEELKKKAPKLPKFIVDLLIMSPGSKLGKKLKKKILDKLKGKKLDMGDLSREWQGRVSNASQGKLKGSMPAGLLRELNALESPELSWLQIIQERFSRKEKKRSWKSANKKWLPFYFPATVKDKSLKAVIAIDTSGSMSKEELTQALSEIWGLANSFKSIELTLITCDAKIHQVFKIENGNKRKLFNVSLKGYGGTDFQPVFRWIKKEFQNMVDTCVYFSDLQGDFPKEKPPYQVYWVSQYPEEKVPFGRIVKLRRTR